MSGGTEMMANILAVAVIVVCAAGAVVAIVKNYRRAKATGNPACLGCAGCHASKECKQCSSHGACS